LEYKDPEFDKIKKIIEEININNINPVQALVKLNEIIDLLKSSKKWDSFFLLFEWNFIIRIINLQT